MKKIIAYKGFDKDLKCRGFQYQVGKSYKHDGEVKVCKQGFHACENPFDVLDFYDISNGNRFAEVELSGKMEREDKKIVAGHITIKAELGFPEFISQAVDFLIDLCRFSLKNKEIEQSSGDYAKIGSSGDAAKIGSSGDAAKIGSSGYAAKITCEGKYCVVSAIGVNSCVKAKKGTWITLAEYDKEGKPVCVKTEQVDGEKIKEDVFYCLKNGDFKEVDDGRK